MTVERIRSGLLSCICILLAAVIMLSLILFSSDLINTPQEFDYVDLSTGWTMSKNGETAKTVSLQSADIGIMNTGDVLTISHIIPDISVPGRTLFFRSILSTVNVYLDDNPIYSYGDDFATSGMMLPKHYHYVPLGFHSAGSKLTITFTATEPNAFSGISNIWIGNADDLTTMQFQSRRMELIVAVFLAIFGFIQFNLFVYLRLSRGFDTSLLFSALISFFLGIYILCYYDILSFLSPNDYFFTTLEYISLFIVPAPIVGLLQRNCQNYGERILKFFIVADVLFNIITLVCHFTGIAHLNKFVPAMHVGALIESVCGIYLLSHVLISNYRRRNDPSYIKSDSATILIGGLLIFIICAVIDMIKFDLLKFVSDTGEAHADVSFITLGALSFVMCLGINYFFHVSEHINEESVRRQLEGLAYYDQLTGISNRARCQQILKELSYTRSEYCIISIDLDRLKVINDEFGHTMGDLMIRDFATVLSKVFSDARLTGRMGGDEFIVILDLSDAFTVDRKLREFRTQLHRFKTSDPSYQLRASCGYAFSWECHYRASEVYMLADSRMYKEKEIHHARMDTEGGSI